MNDYRFIQRAIRENASERTSETRFPRIPPRLLPFLPSSFRFAQIKKLKLRSWLFRAPCVYFSVPYSLPRWLSLFSPLLTVLYLRRRVFPPRWQFFRRRVAFTIKTRAIFGRGGKEREGGTFNVCPRSRRFLILFTGASVQPGALM